MNIRTSVSWILLASAVGMGVAACGSSSNTASSSTPTAAASSPSASATATPAATPSASSRLSANPAEDQKAITKVWNEFFDGKVSPAQKVGLLENGAQFAAVLKATGGANGPGAAASAKVTKVTVMTPYEATVTYDVLVSGTPALTNQTGIAVYQNGGWKVSVKSFCGLLLLESGGKKTGLPAACK